MFGKNLITVVCVLSLNAYSLARNIDNTPTQGLYDPDDDVLIINNDTFHDNIFNQEHATLLEFYNSFCGHCRRYAPIWKAFASNVLAWQRVVQIAAVDCSADENNMLCRKYEVMAYPSLRYFPPYFNDTNTFGSPMSSDPDEATLRANLVDMLHSETHVPSHWPTFKVLSDTNTNHLFDGHSDQVHFIFLIAANGTMANEIALDFVTSPNIAIRWISSPEVAYSYGMSNLNSLSVVNRKLEVYPMSNRIDIRQSIFQFLKEHNITLPITVKPNLEQVEPMQKPKNFDETSNQVFLNDLEQAVWFSLHREITQIQMINGDRLDALKRYLNIIKRYLPVGQSGQQFLNEFDVYVADSNEIRGDQFAAKYSQLMAKWNPINVTSTWVGCRGSTPNVRGYTCGLWELFHYLTIQSANDPYASDPLDALRAIYGYVKHFFGCTECAQHFQTMAEKYHIWRVSSKDDAVIWLWNAHNQVNARLVGDITEDPAHPKIQFPSERDCKKCRNELNIDDSIRWNNVAVLDFLKEYYATSNLSRSKFRRSVAGVYRDEKRIMNVGFSRMDMRVAIMLYVFGLGMVIFAVKMLYRRRYRKKFYLYDYKDNV